MLAGTLLAALLTGLLTLLARLLAAATGALIRRLTLALLTLAARFLALASLPRLAAVLASLRSGPRTLGTFVPGHGAARPGRSTSGR